MMAAFMDRSGERNEGSTQPALLTRLNRSLVALGTRSSADYRSVTTVRGAQLALVEGGELLDQAPGDRRLEEAAPDRRDDLVADEGIGLSSHVLDCRVELAAIE